jgi:hypothetical protein
VSVRASRAFRFLTGERDGRVGGVLVDASKVIATSVALAERERTLRAARRGRSASMEGSPDRIAALVAASTALERAGVRHALIGGVAVGIHSGVARATEDVDLAISSTADLAAVAAVLERAGFRPVGRFEHSANFRHASGEPVRLAFDPGFDARIERAERIAAGRRLVMDSRART